jgi:hypothetical protein
MKDNNQDQFNDGDDDDFGRPHNLGATGFDFDSNLESQIPQ